MREILFRGKRKDNGEWVVGSKINTFWSEYANRYIEAAIIPIGSKEIFAEGIQYEEVIKETVGQFTGLKDKNGNEIYEGDIVTGLFNHTDIIGHIVYGSDATFFIERKGLYGIGLNNAEDWLEVVGNIHDNKELLREE